MSESAESDDEREACMMVVVRSGGGGDSGGGRWTRRRRNSSPRSCEERIPCTILPPPGALSGETFAGRKYQY